MNPNATQFKLTSSASSTTRRVVFRSRPTWLALADRIHTLFNITLENVAVSYIDVEGDEVTLSTQEELEDYYQDMDGMGLWKPGNAVKFTVLDLSSARKEKEQSFSNEAQAANDSSDEEWQHFPSVPTAPPSIAQVDSIDSIDNNDAHTQASTLTSGSATPTPRIEEKGKGRAVQIEEVPDEDASIASASTLTSTAVNEPIITSVLSPAPAPQDHSKAPNDKVEASSANPDMKARSSDGNDDPPLPALDQLSLEADLASANPALSADISNLISSLSNIVVSHPEVSEAVRSIIQNATRGSYWPAQRDAMQRAAGNVAESLRHADQEAGKRVAEALEKFFQAFAQFTATGAGNETQSTNRDPQPTDDSTDNATTNDAANIPNPFEDPHHSQPSFSWGGAGGFGRMGRFGGGRGRMPHFPPGFPFGGRHPHHHHHHHHPPPPPPPPHPHPPSPFGPDLGRIPGEFPPPPPPPPAMPPHTWTNVFGPHGFTASFSDGNFFTTGSNGPAHSSDGRAWLESLRRGPSGNVSGNGNVNNIQNESSATLVDLGEQQADTGSGNENDKAKDKDDTAPKPPPKAGMSNININVHRSNTLPTRRPGFSSRHPWHSNTGTTTDARDTNLNRRSTSTQDAKERSMRRILRKLGDMGFTARAHPELPTRIRESLSSSSNNSSGNASVEGPEREEEITTALVNELLSKPATTGSPGAAGGSGMMNLNLNLPGAWN
ncbi:hypothetical protein AAF712_016072 [Marasmius tenuissimus]|uniref:PB1 domain-containing protein n=1 Tax=Marasmius tenuissimus TaxID=585030 RepID=A0ABR2Z7I2_9AGAR